jgi:hypothetical protein
VLFFSVDFFSVFASDSCVRVPKGGDVVRTPEQRGGEFFPNTGVTVPLQPRPGMPLGCERMPPPS